MTHFLRTTRRLTPRVVFLTVLLLILPGLAESSFGQARESSVPLTPAESDPATKKVADYVDYDQFDRMTEKRTPLGNTLLKTYQGRGNRLSKVSLLGVGNGLSVNYAYNPRGLLKRIVRPGSTATRYRYDLDGRLETVKNDGGEAVTRYDYHYTYPGGDPSSDPSYVQTRRLGGASPATVTREVVDGLGRTWQRVTEAGGGSTIVRATAYDSVGWKASSYRPLEDADGGIFDADGDYKGQPSTDMTYERSPLGRPSQVDPPEPDGQKVQKSYGSEQNPFRADTTLTGYDSYTFRYVQTTDESGDAKRVYKDGFGQKVVVAAGYDDQGDDDPTTGTAEAVTYFQYDTAGTLTKVIKPEGDAVHYEYDARGRQTLRYSADAGTTRTAYDAAGNPRFTQNAAQQKQGTVQYTCVDGAGRATESGVAPLSEFGTDTFEALDASQLGPRDEGTGGCAVADEWRKTVTAHDGPPSGDPWNSWGGWTDGDGTDPPLTNLAGRTAARAERVADAEVVLGGGGAVEGPTVRTALDRTVVKSTTMKGEVTLTAGDEVRLKPGFSTEDGATFKATVDSSKQTSGPEWRLTFFSYDAEGQVTRKDVFAPGLGQVTLTYQRDRQRRVIRRTVTLQRQGKSFTQWYEYNARGKVKKVYASTGSTKPSTAEVTYTYAADGQVTSADWASGPQVTRSYNARGWLKTIGDLSAPDGFAGSYDYRADGNVEAMTSNPQGDAQFTYEYKYDALERLQSADYGGDGLGGAYDVGGLEYDRNGNLEALTRRGSGGRAVDDLGYTYDANRLTSVNDAAGAKYSWDTGSGSFEYDAAGRMLGAPAPTGLEAASYNAQGLPTAMALSGGKTVTYRYSGGQRTYKKVEGDPATHYVRDGSVTLAVVEGGSLQHWNVTLPGGEVIGRRTSGGGERYYLKDHLGSIRAVLDGSGAVKETRDYYPFGLPMPGRYDKGSPPTDGDFTGHVKDEATGLHYAGARYYSAAFARWTTTDPILREQSAAKLLKDGKVRAFSMSAYNYSFNNPVKFKDKTGEYPTPWDVLDFAAAAHSVSQAVQNPTASNIGWAAADVGAAALPIVPSTKGARLVAKHGDEAIQAVKAGIGKSELAQQFAKGAKALGKSANNAKSIAKLEKLGKVSGKQIELKAGTGTKIAKSLTGSKSLETSKDGASKFLKNVDIGGKKAKRVSVYKGSKTTGGPSVQIKWANGKERKIRVPDEGFE